MKALKQSVSGEKRNVESSMRRIRGDWSESVGEIGRGEALIQNAQLRGQWALDSLLHTAACRVRGAHMEHLRILNATAQA